MATRYVTTLHRPDPAHLAEVIGEMRGRGAPVIRVYESCGDLIAVEGVHRMAAADALGLAVEIELVDRIPDDSDLNEGAFAGREVDEEIETYLRGAEGKTYEVEV
jgi:hypothetical protein